MFASRLFVRIPWLAALWLSTALACRGDSVVVFNEIMYHPSQSEARFEWIELCNQMSYDIDLSDWSIRGGIEYDFPVGTTIQGGGYLLVALSPAEFAGETPYFTILGPFSGRLSNSGEQLRLLNNTDRMMDAVAYGVSGDWPPAPDGSGVSLAKIDPQNASAPGENWTWSAQVGGTPGRRNFDPTFRAAGGVALVETLAPARVLVPSGPVPSLDAWTALEFDHSNWIAGRIGVGYETRASLAASYKRAIALDVQDALYEVNRSCYVRIPFDLPDPSRVTSLTLRVKYDAGFVAYLNGRELARANTPTTGSLAWDAGAAKEHYGAAALNFEYFDASQALDALRPGPNVLAIHALSSALDSIDFLILPELAAQVRPSEPQPVFNEASANEAGAFWIEIANQAAQPRDLTGYALAFAGDAERPYVFPETVLDAGEFLTIEESTLGFRPEAGDTLFLFTPDRKSVADSFVVEATAQSRYPDGKGPWLRSDAETPGAPNRVTLQESVVINEIMYHQRLQADTPALPAVYDSVTLLPIAASWKYDQSGADLGSAWKEPGFADGGWPSGQGALGASLGALPAPLGTPLKVSGQTTFYFRARFEYDGNLEGYAPMLNPLLDDGAVFYLNGVEVYRENMPEGDVEYRTTATTGVRFATFSGPTAISAESLVVGTNVLAVELHQASPTSTDAVLGAIISMRKLDQPATPPKPVLENPEEWIELYNRGDASVDLSGWRLADAVDFTFATSTTLAPGAYLVIAKDAPSLREKFPDANVLGNFERALANETDRIALLDALGNPADAVRYYDDFPWPGDADGYGSSLELRDPRSDNAKPEAWAASDESGKSEWQTIRYSAEANQIYGPDEVWHEFILGMVGAGEVLIDDVSILEEPDGGGTELMQDVDFETNYSPWHFSGNHRHSEIIDDPQDPENKVLRLKATGYTETYNNHAYAILTKELRNGQNYQISLRAKWLSGSSLLNLRLYHNKLARTIQLDGPPRTGTPGAINSQYTPNLGPAFSSLRHSPPVPSPGEPVVVSVAAADPDGIADCRLFWALDGDWEAAHGAAQMVPGSDGAFTATIPGQDPGAVVQFYVEATDGASAAACYPEGGRDSRALFQVADGQTVGTGLHNFRIVMTRADLDFMFANPNLMSDERLGGTVVYDEREVFHDVRVRLKGSPCSRPDVQSVGYHVQFRSDRKFRGVHASVAIDRSGRLPVTGGQDEIYLKHIFNRAKVPWMVDDLIHLIAPQTQHTGGALLQMARYNDMFFETQWKDGDKGYGHDFTLLFYPNTTTDGKPESPKQASCTYLSPGLDFEYLGDDEETYRWQAPLLNGRGRDDYQPFIALVKAMSAPTERLAEELPKVMNVNQWLRCHALRSLCGPGDAYTFDEHRHNIHCYIPPDGSGAVLLPWDMDFVLYQATGYMPLWGNQDTNLRRLTADVPAHRRLFYGHLKDLIETVFNEAYMGPWLEHYSSLLPDQDFSGQVAYIRDRGNFVLSQLPREPESPTFAITRADTFVTTSPLARIGGTAWIDLKDVFVEGMSEPLKLTWTSSGSGRNEVFYWRADVPVELGENDLLFAAYGIDGNLITTATQTVTRSPLARSGAAVWTVH